MDRQAAAPKGRRLFWFATCRRERVAMTPFKLLDLFSGIGGFSLGLERTGGFKTVAFCEIEPFCRRVLAKHWPEVPCYDDVRSLTAESLSRDGITVEAICGGFPCQDISSAGKRSGLNGERSGLWGEYARIICEIRPRIVIVENVADLLHRGIADVLGNLAEIGYDAEWHCIPASYVGAPHLRDRVWIVAYPNSGRLLRGGTDARDGGTVSSEGVKRVVCGGDSRESSLADAYGLEMVGAAVARQERDSWPDEPCVDRVADGVSRELVEPRLKALGNAVVPQIPELIGRAIMESLQ
jgi:DNA (cytosine-5)-methyltransferase 1